MTKLYPVLYAYFNHLGKRQGAVRFSNELFASEEEAYNYYIINRVGHHPWTDNPKQEGYRVIRLMTEWPIVNNWELYD